MPLQTIFAEETVYLLGPIDGCRVGSETILLSFLIGYCLFLLLKIAQGKITTHFII